MSEQGEREGAAGFHASLPPPASPVLHAQLQTPRPHTHADTLLLLLSLPSWLCRGCWLRVCVSHLGARGAGDQRLAHVADIEGGGRFDVVPVLAQEGVLGLLLACECWERGVG